LILQLPLSGSRISGYRRKSDYVSSLSTPSLGITSAIDKGIRLQAAGNFQLPLSGSQAEEARKDPSPGDLPGFQLPLSGSPDASCCWSVESRSFQLPLSGSPAHKLFLRKRHSCRGLSTPSLGITVHRLS